MRECLAGARVWVPLSLVAVLLVASCTTKAQSSQPPSPTVTVPISAAQTATSDTSAALGTSSGAKRNEVDSAEGKRVAAVVAAFVTAESAGDRTKMASLMAPGKFDAWGEGDYVLVVDSFKVASVVLSGSDANAVVRFDASYKLHSNGGKTPLHQAIDREFKLQRGAGDTWLIAGGGDGLVSIKPGS